MYTVMRLSFQGKQSRVLYYCIIVLFYYNLNLSAFMIYFIAGQNSLNCKHILLLTFQMQFGS